MMTALITLENVSNWYETFTIKSSDLVGGSGPTMYDGDQLSFMDALYLMMLPSSNITAKAMGRVIGHKIIQARGYI
jgi:D-alanyl-D-alanine carboxypeptidase